MDWMRTKNCFWLLSVFFISAVLEFCCTEPSTKPEWPSAAAEPWPYAWTFGSGTSRGGTEKGLLARGSTYKIRPKVIHMTISKYYNARSRVFQRAMLGCCTLRSLAVSLENGYLCSAFLLQNYSKLGSKLFLSKSGSEIFTSARK